MRTVGIIQPNFLPWRGYFDFIREVDVFVFLDDVQYTKQDWRNRNRIRRPQGGSEWLTVPVQHAPLETPIREICTDERRDWRHAHLMRLRHAYGDAPHFAAAHELLASEYAEKETSLLALCVSLTRRVMARLGIQTELCLASNVPGGGRKDARLIEIVRYLGGDRYLSGAAARDYIRPELWRASDIELAWKSYDGYPEYPQISPPFDPFVSVIDLLCMTGPDAPRYLDRRPGPAGREDGS